MRIPVCNISRRKAHHTLCPVTCPSSSSHHRSKPIVLKLGHTSGPLPPLMQQPKRTTPHSWTLTGLFKILVFQRGRTHCTSIFETVHPQDFLPIVTTYIIRWPYSGNYRAASQLTLDAELVLCGARIVAPAALCCHTLSQLHDSHRGIEATKQRAQQTVYCPGIKSDIASIVQACEPCQVLQPSLQQEPLQNDDDPTRPFEPVSPDYFNIARKSFLVMTDRFSGWPLVAPCYSDNRLCND